VERHPLGNKSPYATFLFLSAAQAPTGAVTSLEWGLLRAMTRAFATASVGTALETYSWKTVASVNFDLGNHNIGSSFPRHVTLRVL
jgi:hypothetical protein